MDYEFGADSDKQFEELFDDLIEHQSTRSQPEQDHGLKSFFKEIDLAWTNTKEELPADPTNLIRFYRDPTDATIYLFDTNTQRAYPLHPTMSPVTFALGQNAHYAKIPADQVTGRSGPKQ